MSDFETRLATLLQDAVEEPRRGLDPEDVFAARSGRGRTVALATLAAAVIVAITLGVTLIHTRRHDATGPGPRPSSPHISNITAVPATTTDPEVLSGRTWSIDRLRGMAGAADTKPDAVVPFVFNPPAAGVSVINVGPMECTSATARITAGRITFVQPFVTETQTNCGPGLGVAQSRFVYRLLHGHVTWSVTGRELTITHPGLGSVEFTDTAPSGTVHLTLHLDETTAPADGQPISGYVTVSNETGHPITLRDATCDGWIGVGLTNSRVGYGLDSGLVACAADYLPVGSSRTPIKVQTTYQGCSASGDKYNRQLSAPPRIGPKHQDIPPLPPGRYETKVETQNVTPGIAAPIPVTVILTTP